MSAARASAKDASVWVLLCGELGAGKSTLARAILKYAGAPAAAFEGSPTFAIAHEYQGGARDLIHLDLYRLRDATELESAGVYDYFGGRSGAWVLVEWADRYPELVASLEREASVHPERATLWKIGLIIEGELTRAIRILQTSDLAKPRSRRR